MRRIMLKVSYDGTNYNGWQWQPNGITIEEVLNRELSRLLKEDIHVRGTSRTDAGVHALGNLCIFDTETRIPAEKICYAVNHSLPEDIVVQDSCEVPGNYHPRKCVSVKTYEYTISRSRFPNPLDRRYAYSYYMPMDVEQMRIAAAYLVGEHDFKSFCSKRTEVETTVRTILSLDIREEGAKVIFRIRGTGFLYNMVRIIVGTLLDVGRGVYPPQHVKEILESCDRANAGRKVPSEGLCLMEIALAMDPWEWALQEEKKEIQKVSTD